MSSVIYRTMKGGAGFFASSLIRKAFGFLFVVVASRTLGPASFGVLALALSVMRVSQNLAAFGLPNTIQRFLSGSGAYRSAQLLGAILLVGGASASLASAALYMAAPTLSSIFGEPALIGPLRVLSVAILVGVGVSLTRSLLQAQERVEWIVVVDTVRSVAKVGLLVLLFLTAQTVTNAAWAVVGSFGLGLLVAGEYVRRSEFFPSFASLVTHTKTVLSYSAPLVVVGFSYLLAQQADRLMLGWLANASEVGIYTVTSKLAMVMGVLHGSLVSIFKPIASEAYRNDSTQQMRRSYLFVSKWVGTANGMALLVFAGAGPWLLHLFGMEYATDTTYGVLIILSTLYFLGTWVGPTGALLQMSDGHRIELANTIVFVVTNITLNYVLITMFGVMGAALATLLSGLLRNVLQVLELAYWHGITPFAPTNLAILVLTGAGTLMLTLMTGGVHRIGSAIGAVGILGGFVLWTASDKERRALQGIYSRVVSAA